MEARKTPKQAVISRILQAVTDYTVHCVSAAPLMNDRSVSEEVFDDAVVKRDCLWREIARLLEDHVCVLSSVDHLSPVIKELQQTAEGSNDSQKAHILHIADKLQALRPLYVKVIE
jgi:hypothetical protein